MKQLSKKSPKPAEPACTRNEPAKGFPTPHEIATMAARLWPEECSFQGPKREKAILDAKRLIEQAATTQEEQPTGNLAALDEPPSYEEFLKSNGLKDGERIDFNKGILIATGHRVDRKLDRARGKFAKIMSTCAAQFMPKEEGEALRLVRRRDASKLAGLEIPFYWRDLADMKENGFTAKEIYDIHVLQITTVRPRPSQKKKRQPKKK